MKLIGEPWDIGPGGYQVGGFPPGWAEWNDKYRDTVRDYWKGNEGMMGDFAARVTGSGDVYDIRGRRPWAGVNFITAHDGFTLNDLVSYNEKHNEANGEDNKDGHSDNRSFNYGAEGPTDDAGINAVRERQKRNLLATLLLSHGTPMILAGDEFGRTQHGNNNGYCQDSEISWVDWEGMGDEAKALTEFVRRLIAMRREQPPAASRELSRRHDHHLAQSRRRRTDGGTMGGRRRQFHRLATLNGQLENNDAAWSDVIIAFNAHDGAVPFKLPQREGRRWKAVIDTNAPKKASLKTAGATKQSNLQRAHWLCSSERLPFRPAQTARSAETKSLWKSVASQSLRVVNPTWRAGWGTRRSSATRRSDAPPTRKKSCDSRLSRSLSARKATIVLSDVVSMRPRRCKRHWVMISSSTVRRGRPTVGRIQS